MKKLIAMAALLALVINVTAATAINGTAVASETCTHFYYKLLEPADTLQDGDEAYDPIFIGGSTMWVKTQRPQTRAGSAYLYRRKIATNCACADSATGYYTNNLITSGIVFFTSGNTDPVWYDNTDFDSDFETQCKSNRKAFADLRNYSIKDTDAGFVAIRWEWAGTACDATWPKNRTFYTKDGALRFINAMQSFYAEKLKTADIVWGRKK